MRIALAVSLLLLAAGNAQAAERGYTITSFDRIRVAGPYEVVMRSGVGPSARASGSEAGLDRLSVEVQDNVLIIRPLLTGASWNDSATGKITVAITGPGVISATMTGSGTLTIDRSKGDRVTLAVNGSGTIAVGAVQATDLVINLTGSGDVHAAGQTVTARATLVGSGDIDAKAVVADDAQVASTGSGNVTLSANRTATLNVQGSGDVTVTGRAKCSVTRTGSGEARCG